jgi:hypothetical protein
MIDDDTSFVLKNLALYNEEQRRRLTGNVVDIHQSNGTRKNDSSIPSSDNDKIKNMDETNSDLDQFFHNSDLSPMTPESQNLLDAMFSS